MFFVWYFYDIINPRWPLLLHFSLIILLPKKSYIYEFQSKWQHQNIDPVETFTRANVSGDVVGRCWDLFSLLLRDRKTENQTMSREVQLNVSQKSQLLILTQMLKIFSDIMSNGSNKKYYPG